MDIMSLFKEIDGKHVALSFVGDGLIINMDIPYLCINTDGEFMWGNNIVTFAWESRKWDISEIEEETYEFRSEGMTGSVSIIT